MPNTDEAWLDYTHDIRNGQDDYWAGYEEWCEENEPEHDGEAEYQDYLDHSGVSC